jgi:hypothetical protein
MAEFDMSLVSAVDTADSKVNSRDICVYSSSYFHAPSAILFLAMLPVRIMRLRIDQSGLQTVDISPKVCRLKDHQDRVSCGGRWVPLLGCLHPH